MKLKTSPSIAGFTLSEMLVSLSLSSIVLAAAITCGISLQKSFNAVDNYFSTQMQQIRIIDYLNRDVKRGLVVTTSVDLQSVTMSVPKYIIQAGDPEAIADPESIGMPRTPTVAYTTSGWQVNYSPSTTTVVYSISGNSILRTENGVVTTIASNFDAIVCARQRAIVRLVHNPGCFAYWRKCPPQLHNAVQCCLEPGPQLERIARRSGDGR